MNTKKYFKKTTIDEIRSHQGDKLFDFAIASFKNKKIRDDQYINEGQGSKIKGIDDWARRLLSAKNI